MYKLYAGSRSHLVYLQGCPLSPRPADVPLAERPRASIRSRFLSLFLPRPLLFFLLSANEKTSETSYRYMFKSTLCLPVHNMKQSQILVI